MQNAVSTRLPPRHASYARRSGVWSRRLADLYGRCQPVARSGAVCWALGLLLSCGQSERYRGDIEELLEQGAAELSYYNFDLAHSLFAQARSQAEPNSSAWARATFGLATAAQNRTPPSPKRIEEAVNLYDQLSRTTTEPRLAARSMLNLGRLAEIRDHRQDQADPEAARRYYRQVFETWPDLPIAGEAVLRYGDTYVQAFDDPASVQTGVSFVESWIQHHFTSPYAPIFHEYLGQVRLSLMQNAAAALADYRRADALGFVEPTAVASLYWLIAELSAGALNDPSTAAAYYQRIILETPRSGRAFEAQLALRALKTSHRSLEIEIPEIDRLYELELPVQGQAAEQKEVGP